MKGINQEQKQKVRVRKHGLSRIYLLLLGNVNAPSTKLPTNLCQFGSSLDATPRLRQLRLNIS